MRASICLLLMAAGSAFAQVDPSIAGRWSAPVSWPDKMVHAIGLPTGKILWIPHQDDPYEYDPVTGAQLKLPRAGYNLFCGGHSLAADGKPFITGGTIVDPEGLPDASSYNPNTRTWERLPDMRAGRYYPSNTTLGNGEILVTGGSDESAANNTIPEVWEPANRRFRLLTGASFEIPNYYPWMFLLPSGRVFHAGPTQQGWVINPSGSGSLSSIGYTRSGLRRSYGSAAMYAPGKILIMGGSYPPSASAEVIDLNQASPSWRLVSSMNRARRHHNATLLPDGTVLISGGSLDTGMYCTDRAVLEAELWDPSTEQFRVLAPAPTSRFYHSVALLLDDGRVLSGGGKCAASVEFYSPPYLFKGARPNITSAPSTVRYGASFEVGTDAAASISQVNLLRLNAPTHAFDESQAICKLTFSRGSSSVTAMAPTNPNACPPGHYRLFLLTGTGVPSIARIVQLLPSGATPTDGGVPPPPPPDAGTGAADAGTVFDGGVIFSDDFNGLHDGLGSQWVVPYGSWSVNGDHALASAPRSYAAWSGTPPADLSVELELARPSVSTYIGVFARGTPSAADRDHYAAYVDPAGRLALARRNAYSYTYLGTGPLFPAGTHVLRLRVSGSSPVRLAVDIDGVEVLAASDSSASRLLSGRAGMFDYNGSGTPLDAFVIRGAGSSSPPPPPPPPPSDAGTGTPDAGTTPTFHDAFNRTGSLGPNWSVARGSFTLDGTSALGTSTNSYAAWTGTPDANATLSLTVSPPTASSHYGIIARANPTLPDRDHYAAYIDPSGVVRLARRDAFNYSYLAAGPKLAAGRHVLSVTATGSSPVTLSVRVDGTEVIRFTDFSSFARPSGRAGIFDYAGRAQPLDDFTVRNP